MEQRDKPKGTVFRMVLFAVILATVATLALLINRLTQFGIEKVLDDLLVYMGLFLFLSTTVTTALFLSARLSKGKPDVDG